MLARYRSHFNKHSSVGSPFPHLSCAETHEYRDYVRSGPRHYILKSNQENVGACCQKDVPQVGQ